MNIDRIIELDKRALEDVSQYQKKRFVYGYLAAGGGRPFVACFGPRGVGKTVLLRQLRAAAENGLYISADTLEPGDSLREVIVFFINTQKIENVFIDEIHFAKGYAADLKELYDFYSVNIWFTSSVALSLYASTWDLSRRVIPFYLYPFTFREYFFFISDIEVPVLSLEDALMCPISPDHFKVRMYFNNFLRGGLYPFLMQPGTSIQQFDMIIKKILSNDIPQFDPQLTMEDLTLIEKTLTFIGKSPIDGINYSSVSKNIGITKYKAEKYLRILEKTFLLSLVFPKGTNVRKEPKVFLGLPIRLLYRSFEDCIGELREDFFALAMAQHAIDFHYVKSTRGSKTPDFILNMEDLSVVVEVGGKGKGRSQFKGLEYDKKIILYHQSGSKRKPIVPVPGERVPLHCIGFS